MTAPNPTNVPSRRVRVVLLEEDEYVEQYTCDEGICLNLEYMVLWNQKLHIMHPYKDGVGRLFMCHDVAGVHPIPDKYIFGRVTEEHERFK